MLLAVCGNQATVSTFSPTAAVIRSNEDSMKPLVWLGIGLIVAWAVLWLGIKLAVFAVHLLLLIGVVLIGWGLLRRGSAGHPSQ
jgi:hypothetical protein